MSSQIKTIREYAQDLGYMESYEVVGSMKALFALPGLFSGSLSTDYSLHSDNGRDSESTLKNIAIDYTNL